MKTKYLSIVLLSVCVILFGCTPNDTTTSSSEIYLLVDVTASVENSNPLTINADKIAELSGLNENQKTLRVTYSQSILSELSLNRVFSQTLEPANISNFNTYRRKNVIKKYLQSIEDLGISKLKNMEFDRPGSNLFININETINKVAKNNADKQLVLISSDLLNNDSLFSAYNDKQMQQLKKARGFLVDILEEQASITQSLDRMEVIILYQPTVETDENFRLISSVFKNYLITKGVKSVQIQANL